MPGSNVDDVSLPLADEVEADAVAVKARLLMLIFVGEGSWRRRRGC